MKIISLERELQFRRITTSAAMKSVALLNCHTSYTRTRSHCLSPNVSMFLSKAIEGNPFIPSINSPRSPTPKTQHSYRKEYNTVDVYQSKNLTGEMPTETTTSLTPTSHIITKVKTMKMSQALLKTERISVSCVSTIPCCKCCVQYRWT